MSAHNVEDVYGLSPLQFGMLFHSLEDSSDTRPYLVQMTEEINGAFDDDCFRDAWQQLIDRHAILRSAFIWEGVSEPVQVVQRTARLPYERQDWRGLPAEVQETRLAEFLAADWERGFDLAQAPLVRVASIRMTAERRIVVWSFHHILLDGWSIQILQQELFALYRGLLDGRPAQLPPTMPYRRYIEWLNSQSPSDSKTFWTDYLDGVTEPTDLHVDRPAGKSGVRESGVGEIEIQADEELFAAARGYARTQRITMNTLVQGLWAILLARYSGNDDVLFGSTISGRSIELPGIESMMGLFINTLPVRGRVVGEERVADWLRALQDEQLDMRQWEYCHLVDVREYSQIPRGEPLFRSILVFENYPVLQEASNVPDGMTSRLVNCVERTGYPLTLVASAGRALEFRFVYDRAMFDDATMERLTGHFQTLLAAVVDGRPETRLSELEMLTAAERQQIVVDWNATNGPYPDAATIHQLIEDRTQHEPEAIALTNGSKTLTYRQVNERANQLAHHLRAHDITPDTLIAVCLDRSPELICTLLGILKAGAAFVPLDPDYPTDRITYMIEDTATPLVITHSQHAERLPGDVPLLLVDSRWPTGAETSNPVPVASPDHLAYVIYTSGSTGRPKGVQLDHRGVVNYLHWCDHNYPVTTPNGIGTLLYSSVTFDLTITALFLPLIQGQQLAIPMPGPDQSAFDAAIDTILTGTHISFLKATPSHLEVLAAHLETTGKHHNITTIVAGGEDLSPTLANRILNTSAITTTIANEYGATEGSVANVMSLNTTINPHNGTTPVGTPITNTTAYIVDHHNHPVPIGIPGEALLGGICVARGYLNRPELTNTRFTNLNLNGTTQHVYRTGDLVKWRPDGQMEFIGRIDNQVKLRGYRIELGEIENNLLTHPQLTDATVILREDTPGDKRLVAYLVTTTTAPTTTELRTHLQQHLPDYMIPTTYITLDHLPLTPNGKVDQKALPTPDNNRPDLAATYTPPRTPVEEAIAAIWSSVLGVARVGVHDNFFELGGQSINAVRVASRISEAGWRVSLQQIMRHTTVADLAAAIAAPKEVTSGLIVRLSDGPSENLPRLFCIHPGGGSTHSYRALAARLAGSYDVYGVQAAGLNPGESPIVGVEAMAARYWEEIRSVQPQGPCLLLGWSTGAVVAHELCVQRPDEVAAAYLLEPAVTGPEQRARFERYAEIYRQVDALWQRGQQETGDVRAETERALKRLAPRMNIEVEAVTLDEWLPYEVLEAEVRSLATYRPGRAFTRTSLFVSESVRAAGPEGTSDEVGPAQYTAHWQQRYPAGLEVLDMAGRHLQMVHGEEQLEAVVSAIEKQQAQS